MKVLINAVSAKMGGAVRHLPPFVEALAALNPDIVLLDKPPRLPRVVWDSQRPHNARPNPFFPHLPQPRRLYDRTQHPVLDLVSGP